MRHHQRKLNIENTIATIPKNQTQDIHIRLCEFHGRPFVDIRLFVVADATGDRVPTRKGIAIPPALLPEVIDALRAAEQEIRAQGLAPG